MKRCHKKLKVKRKAKKRADRKRKKDIYRLKRKAAHKKKYYDYLGSDKWHNIRNKVIKLRKYWFFFKLLVPQLFFSVGSY